MYSVCPCKMDSHIVSDDDEDDDGDDDWSTIFQRNLCVRKREVYETNTVLLCNDDVPLD